jgi:hypothetical protein
VSIESDRDLEQLFRAERAQDARHAAPFGRVMSRRSQAVNRWRLWPALAFGVALLAVVIWRLTPISAREPLFAFVPGELRVPTDYLLELVTIPRAGEIPRVGVVDWYPLESSPNNRSNQ